MWRDPRWNATDERTTTANAARRLLRRPPARRADRSAPARPPTEPSPPAPAGRRDEGERRPSSFSWAPWAPASRDGTGPGDVGTTPQAGAAAATPTPGAAARTTEPASDTRGTTGARHQPGRVAVVAAAPGPRAPCAPAARPDTTATDPGRSTAPGGWHRARADATTAADAHRAHAAGLPPGSAVWGVDGAMPPQPTGPGPWDTGPTPAWTGRPPVTGVLWPRRWHTDETPAVDVAPPPTPRSSTPPRREAHDPVALDVPRADVIWPRRWPTDETPAVDLPAVPPSGGTGTPPTTATAWNRSDHAGDSPWAVVGEHRRGRVRRPLAPRHALPGDPAGRRRR